ncbi:MAG: threonine/serine dehydratase [Gemmatimonadaceae bacterium]
MIGPTATTPSSDEPLVSLADIQSAASRLKGQAIHTPIISALDLGSRLGVPCGVKAESFQRTGSFKFRGAFNYISTMDPSARARGVIAPSSGNHGLAVACVAAIFGVPATIVMPTNVTTFKRAGVERYGATAVLAGITTDDRMSAAEELARSTGAEIVPPYDDLAIIAGQATCGLEIITDQPGASTFVVPVGGGGLSGGIATVVKLSRPDVHVVAVEPDGAAKLSAAWRSGSPVRLDNVGSAADGLLAVRIGARNFAHLQRYADEVVTVSEKEIVEATAYMYRELKLVAEPSGATALAALLAGKVSPTGETIAVLSGGNISLDALRDYCAEV